MYEQFLSDWIECLCYIFLPFFLLFFIFLFLILVLEFSIFSILLKIPKITATIFNLSYIIFNIFAMGFDLLITVPNLITTIFDLFIIIFNLTTNNFISLKCYFHFLTFEKSIWITLCYIYQKKIGNINIYF